MAIDDNDTNISNSLADRDTYNGQTDNSNPLEDYSSEERSVGYNLFIATTMALGGPYSGFYMSIFNPMGEPLLNTVYQVGDKYSSIIGNINLFFSIGAMVCVLISGPAANFIGRYKMVLIAEALSFLTYFLYTVEDINLL